MLVSYWPEIARDWLEQSQLTTWLGRLSSDWVREHAIGLPGRVWVS